MATRSVSKHGYGGKDDLVAVNKNLSQEGFEKLLYSYNDKTVTNELYSFGSAWITEIQQRGTLIESKATALMGWSTGILAFSFANLKSFEKSPLLLEVAILSSSVFLVLAVIFSFLALRARNSWQSYTDLAWLPEAIAKCGEDDLKRYHIVAMYKVKISALKNINDKAKWLQRTQWSLLAGSVSFLVAIATTVFVHF